MDFDSDHNERVIARLTPEQRLQVYEEEKERIADEGPLFSRTTIVVAAVYLLGCVLTYFGIPMGALSLWAERSWKPEPMPDIFITLGMAAGQLMYPFVAVVITFWAVAIPPLLIWGFWSFGEDIVAFIKKYIGRNQ